MFGNIDMNQINSMLQSMKTDGFDFNNLNLGNLNKIMNRMRSSYKTKYNNSNGIRANLHKAIIEQITKDINNRNIQKIVEYEDENIQLSKWLLEI